MAELQMKGKIEGNSNGYALIRKLHIVLIVSILVITNLGYILYREMTTSRTLEDHEKRIINIEKQGNMSVETNMNLREYFKALGYKWIEIPK